MDRYEKLNAEYKINKKKKKVAAYCRVSTDKDDQAGSFENQRLFFKEYIENHPDWKLYEIFADEGISGTNTKKRKEFRRMIACAENGDFDLIITKEISRFARNTLDSIYYTRELKKHGIGVIFMNDNINTLDGDAELRLAIMSSIAQEESRKTSERVKWGQKRQMEKGVVFGRNMLGYDVKDGKMYINERGAEIVRLIFGKAVFENKGAYVIAKELRGKTGITNLQSSTVLRILRNEKYCGDLVQKKTYTPDFLSHEKKSNKGQEEFIIIKNHHEPIISREIFEQANRILDIRAKKRSGITKFTGRYPFSGKIQCGKCGSRFAARYKTRNNGNVYKAWCCLKRSKNGKENGCSARIIKNEEIINAVRRILEFCVFDFEKESKHFVKLISQETAKSQACNLQDKKKMMRLIELYTGGIIEKDEFLSIQEKYKNNVCAQYCVTEENIQPSILSKIKEIIANEAFEESFYSYITEKAVVLGDVSLDIYLKDGTKLSFIQVK